MNKKQAIKEMLRAITFSREMLNFTHAKFPEEVEAIETAAKNVRKAYRPKKMKKSSKGWKWGCSASNPRYGHFHADAEWCQQQSKMTFPTKQLAEEAGKRHASKCYCSKQYGESIYTWKQ